MPTINPVNWLTNPLSAPALVRAVDVEAARVASVAEEQRGPQEAADSQPPPKHKKPWLDPTKGADAAKPLALGFTALTAVLTFFGIQGGALDRILGQSPYAILWIFALIGAGVLAAILAVAIDSDPDPRVSVPWFIVVLGVAAAITWLLVPLHEPAVDGTALLGSLYTLGDTLAFILFVLVVVVLAALADGRYTTLVAATLAISVAALALGLYGATALSLRSKAEPVSPRASADVTTTDSGAQTLKLDLRAGRIPADRSLRLVFADGADLLGKVDVAPDANGDINQKISFPLPLEGFAGLRVFACRVPVDEGEEPCAEQATDPTMTDQALVVLNGQRGGSESLTGTLEAAEGDGVLAAKVTAIRHPSGVLPVELRCGAETLITGSVPVSAAGRATWSSTVGVGSCAGDLVVLLASRCDKPTCESPKPEQLASYRLPVPSIPAG